MAKSKVVTTPEENADKTANLIITNTGVYDLELFEREKTVPEYGKAYILREEIGDDDVFYFYRGRLNKNSVLPGIYRGTDELITIIEPLDSERPNYVVKTHMASLNPGDMMAILKDKKNIKHVITEKSQLFIPEVSSKDNILKRALKEAFQAKGVTIEECKSGFTDRNAFFNFSSVMRSEEGNITFLLMDRGCNALKLGYAIVLYELDPENPIGRSLEDPSVSKDLANIPIKSQNPIVDTNNGDPVVKVDGKVIVSSGDSFAI